MTPKEAIQISQGQESTFTGRWPKMNVYDQNDQSRKIIIDPNICSGCAVANVYQSMTGQVGDYARYLYEGAKQRRENHKEETGGISLHEVCEYATEKFGGDYYRLSDIREVLSWILVVGPVAIGFDWRSGMEYPRHRGRWWNRFFGARWATRTGPVMGKHAVCLLGLGGPPDDRYVVLENSRGMAYGNKGTSRMSVDVLEECFKAGEVYAYGIDFKIN